MCKPTADLESCSAVTRSPIPKSQFRIPNPSFSGKTWVGGFNLKLQGYTTTLRYLLPKHPTLTERSRQELNQP